MEPDGDPVDGRDLDAGGFSEWLHSMQGALGGAHGSDVPCDGCTACCRSSQFVHIGPQESEALAHIRPELLFPAPLMDEGHVLLGYDADGRCPMLVDDGCSIYEHRPRTCRTYDCRVFPASGLGPGDDKALIAERARRWRFDLPTDTDHREYEAVRAAARFLVDHRNELSPAAAPTTPTQFAVLAVGIADAFLAHGDGVDRPAVVEPGIGEVRLALAARPQPGGQSGR